MVGHRSTTVTETVHHKQLRPVIEGGADVMDRIFPAWRARRPRHERRWPGREAPHEDC